MLCSYVHPVGWVPLGQGPHQLCILMSGPVSLLVPNIATEICEAGLGTRTYVLGRSDRITSTVLTEEVANPGEGEAQGRKAEVGGIGICVLLLILPPTHHPRTCCLLPSFLIRPLFGPLPL